MSDQTSQGFVFFDYVVEYCLTWVSIHSKGEPASGGEAGCRCFSKDLF